MSQNIQKEKKLSSNSIYKIIYKIIYKKREEQWEKLTDMMMNKLHNEETRRKYLELELEKLKTKLYYMKGAMEGTRTTEKYY